MPPLRALAVVLLAACSSSPKPDAAVDAAPAVDASLPDASPPDASLPDAGLPDCPVAGGAPFDCGLTRCYVGAVCVSLVEGPGPSSCEHPTDAGLICSSGEGGTCIKCDGYCQIDLHWCFTAHNGCFASCAQALAAGFLVSRDCFGKEPTCVKTPEGGLILSCGPDRVPSCPGP